VDWFIRSSIFSDWRLDVCYVSMCREYTSR
jgi:hypothetical protein